MVVPLILVAFGAIDCIELGSELGTPSSMVVKLVSALPVLKTLVVLIAL